MARRRVFLAGDAAHQQPPFIGQGMCQGIRDVTNLCWKLVSVLGGEAADELLDTYEQERSVHVRTLTQRIKQIGAAICERDPAAARLRDRCSAEARWRKGSRRNTSGNRASASSRLSWTRSGSWNTVPATLDQGQKWKMSHGRSYWPRMAHLLGWTA